MYQSYNSTQVRILRSLEQLYNVSLLKTFLYINGSHHQYLPVDDYSLRMSSSPLDRSVLSISDYSYISLIYPLLKKLNGKDLYESIRKVKSEIDEALEIVDSMVPIEPIGEWINELINQIVTDIHLNKFLTDNQQVFIDSIHQQYLFDFEITSRIMDFDIDIRSNIRLKGNKVRGFKNPINSNHDSLINPLIVFLDDDIRDLFHLTSLLERVKSIDRSLLILCKSADSKVIDLLIKNNNSLNLLNELFILTDNSFEELYDTSKVCGSRVINDEEELSRLKIGDLGYCGYVDIQANHIEFRLNEQNNIPLIIHKQKLESNSTQLNRLDRLIQQTVLLSIGGVTDIDKVYRQHLLSKFLMEVESIRKSDLLLLPESLSSIFKSGLIHNQITTSPSLYISKDHLVKLLKSIYETIRRFLLIGSLVKSN